LKKLLIILFIGFQSVSFSQVLQLKKPAKGDVWPAYSSQRIEWTSSNIDNVKIEYSLDSAKTWNILINSYPASAQYFDWEVPNKTSDSCFIKITDIENSTVSSSNYPANPFKIPSPGIELEQLPNSITSSNILPISWISSGIKKVNLFVSFNNKINFIKIADTIDARFNYYNWLVPDSIVNNCFIKVQDATMSTLTDTSDDAFAIIPKASINKSKYKGGFFDGYSSANNQSKEITLLSLLNGDSLFGGTIQKIKWNFLNIERINIYYSSNNENSWQLIAENYPASAASYNWQASNAPTTIGKIKISDASDTSIYSINNLPFIIRPKALKIDQNITATSVYAHSVLPISWTSGGVNNIKISALHNNSEIVLNDSIPASNEIFNWIIKHNSNDAIQLIVTDISDSTLADTSATIILKQMANGNDAKYKGGSYDGHTAKSNIKGSIRLISLNNNEQIPVNNSYKIQWISNNIENVRLLFSIDSGATWSVISNNTSAASGYFNWNPANTPSNKCLLKIYDPADSSIIDTSDTIFTILPKSILNITDSTNWIKGTAKNIEWFSYGVDTIAIYYKNGLNNEWQTITNSYPGQSETFNWQIPSILGDSIWIKIEDASEKSINVIKSYFNHIISLTNNISPIKYRGGSFDGHSQRSNITKISIKHPAANEVLVGGSKYSITWNSINIEDSILIQYTTDSGANWITIARTVATSGSYEWQVPSSIKGQSIGENYYGKIKSTSLESAISKIIQTAATSLSSRKCMIRILDITAGYIQVGASNQPFTIIAPNVSLIDTINFPKPEDFVVGQPEIILTATSSSKRPVQFFIASNQDIAKLTGSHLDALSAGKLKIGAFLEADNVYENSDTIYHIVCINPVKPVINNVGKNVICKGDTMHFEGPQWSYEYKWSTGDTTPIVHLSKAINLNLKIGKDGCYSSNSDTLNFYLNSFKAVIDYSSKSLSICTGDSILLKSNASSGNQWLLNGIKITGATDSVFSAKLSGEYQLLVNNNGCSSQADSIINLNVYTQIEKPSITLNNGSLISSSSIGNQWYNLYGGVIDGARNSIYRPNVSGFYQTRIVLGGCSSSFSDPFYYLVTGLDNDLNNAIEIKILPNPVRDILYVVASSNENKINLKLFDMSGNLIVNKIFTKHTSLNLSSISSGVYNILLTDLNSKKQKSLEIIKQ